MAPGAAERDVEPERDVAQQDAAGARRAAESVRSFAEARSAAGPARPVADAEPGRGAVGPGTVRGAGVPEPAVRAAEAPVALVRAAAAEDAQPGWAVPGVVEQVPALEAPAGFSEVRLGLVGWAAAALVRHWMRQAGASGPAAEE